MDEAREKQAFEVFLSHNSQDKPAVRALAVLLAEHGIRVWLDEEQLIPGRPWQPLLEEGIRESATGAVLVGADGLGPWENEEMQALLHLAVEEKKPVIPVLLPGAPGKPDLPLFLRSRGWVDLRAGFGTEGMDKLIWGITGEHPGRKRVPSRASEPVIAVTRLRHGADRLVGREKELTRLDTAWQDPKTHVVTIVAWGGVGKTALVVEWMARMARDGWRGAERVFDWSFYSQGTREQVVAAADTFLANALEFFGDAEMAKSAAPAWDKGSRIAQQVAQKRTLLVLDGVEPLQYPPGPLGGRLKDPALEALLIGLAQHNPGLCIVTTRESVTDLKPYRDTTSPEWLLDHLSEEAGAHLLFEAGVKRAGSAPIRADDKELTEAAREVGGHALTLQLLGRYLAKAHNGDVRKRSLVRFENVDTRVQGGHAFKVMAAYEEWLGRGGADGVRQLAVLRLMGLFDRPANAGCLAALRGKPLLRGLTEPLIELGDDDWNYAVTSLAECGLISVQSEPSSFSAPGSVIGTHPLVREYFAEQLRKQDPPAWRSAHRRLYEYLTRSTEYRPSTLEGLRPLYRAVVHGCQGGMYLKAFQMYVDRILRGTGKDGYYSQRKLGAVGYDLAAIGFFFEERWTRPCACFPLATKAWILRQVGYRFRALERLDEAKSAWEGALRIARRGGAKDWPEDQRLRCAAMNAGSLSRLGLLVGEIDAAIDFAREAIGYADQCGGTFERHDARCALAHALQMRGIPRESRRYFDEAERMLGRGEPEQLLQYWENRCLYYERRLARPERLAWRVLTRNVPAIRPAQVRRVNAICDGIAQGAVSPIEIGRASCRERV